MQVVRFLEVEGWAMQIRIIVCGGRSYTDFKRVCSVLDDVVTLLHERPLYVVHGAARGADSLAARWANMSGFDCITFPADWENDGRAAGPIRNQRMLEAGARCVVAFPGGRGTADMMRRGRKAGVPILDVAELDNDTRKQSSQRRDRQMQSGGGNAAAPVVQTWCICGLAGLDPMPSWCPCPVHGVQGSGAKAVADAEPHNGAA